MFTHIIAAVLAAASVCLPTTRTTAGTVTNTCHTNTGIDHAVITTDDGHMWRINDAMEYGSRVTVTFDTNGTDDITDDIIIDIQ